MSSHSSTRQLNSLPVDNIWDGTKLKAFGDKKLNNGKITICVINRVEKNVGKGENAGYQHFLLTSIFSFFPQCFPKPSSLGSLKVSIIW